MKIFISWSGDRSKTVAVALRDWLTEVIQNAEPWMSATDIAAGGRWSREISAQLEVTRVGILCLTSENMQSPWLLFEAGALAKTVNDSAVIPFLIGLEPADVPPGPLTQFQAKRANKTETYETLQAINAAMGADGLPADKLTRAFDKWWPDLDTVLTSPSVAPRATPVQRKTDDMIPEILDAVRGIGRMLTERQPSSSFESIAALLNAVQANADAASRIATKDIFWPKSNPLVQLLEVEAQKAISSVVDFSRHDIRMRELRRIDATNAQIEMIVDGRGAGFHLVRPLEYWAANLSEYRSFVVSNVQSILGTFERERADSIASSKL